MPEFVIEARGLVKSYGDLRAVKGVDLLVERGRVYGALGPNGSGKSTTVRMLLGLARPDAGSVRLFGETLEGNAHTLLRRVGSVVETPAFVPYLSGRDNLRLLEMYNPGPGEAGIERALDRVHLSEAAHRRFKNYSLGMKQRLGIAAAILNEPELIILDEPTNGLDPQGTREIRELIPELASEGRTVVLCSHLLHEVEQVCDALAIFQRGEIIANGTVEQLIGSQAALELVFAAEMAGRAETALAESPWAEQLSRDGQSFRIEAAGSEGMAVNQYLAARQIFAATIRPVRHSLEDAFFELTEEAAARG